MSQEPDESLEVGVALGGIDRDVGRSGPGVLADRRGGGRGRAVSRDADEDHDVGHASSGPAGVKLADRGAHVVGTDSSGDDQAIGELARQRDGPRADPADQKRRHHGRRPVQGDLVEVDVAAVGRHGVALQQGVQRGGVLAQQRQRRFDPGADLAHPVQHAVADAGGQASGEQPGHRGDLHGGQGDVAQRHRQQPDADRDPASGGQDRGRGGDAAFGKAVLPHPQLRQPGRLGGRGDRAEPLRGLRGREDGSQRGHKA